MPSGRFPGSKEFFKPDHRTHTTEELCDLLRRGRILECGLIPWGSNYTFLATMDVGQRLPLLAVYKPRRGEAPLWDFPDGTLYKREYASFLISEALQWCLVPPTVIRKGPNGIGSAQLFIHHREEMADYFALRDQYTHEVQLLAVFDLLTNNTDRKAGHCLLGEDGRIWGIDHGLTFHHHPKLRTVIWDFGGEPIPVELLDDIRRVRAQVANRLGWALELEKLLASVEIEAFLKRMELVLTHPEFPCLRARRGVPWPFY